MYNFAGLDVVRIALVTGKSYLIGTEEPERLAAALNAARKSMT